MISGLKLSPVLLQNKQHLKNFCCYVCQVLKCRCSGVAVCEGSVGRGENWRREWTPLSGVSSGPAGCSVECRAPAEFSSPCGGRGPAVDIRYANEAGCIELVLLEIKGTNSNPKHLHSVCMHQPTNLSNPARRVAPAGARVGSCVVKSRLCRSLCSRPAR